IDWTWETFPEYLATVDHLPKAINYGAYIGHSALRMYVMGKRALSETATDEDLARMAGAVKEAIRAGAMGFSSSRATTHVTPDNTPVASRIADWAEVDRLVGAMGELGAGIFQVGPDISGGLAQRAFLARLQRVAVEGGRAVMFGTVATREGDVMNPCAYQLYHPNRDGRTRPIVDPTQWVPGGRPPHHRSAPPRLRQPLRHEGCELERSDRRPARGGAGPAPRRGDDRSGARERKSGIRAAAGQRAPGSGARHAQAPAHPRHVLGFGRARLPGDGLFAPDPHAELLGTREAGVHSRGGGAEAHLRQRVGLGHHRPWPAARGLPRRPRA